MFLTPHDSTSFSGAVTDNTSSNKLSWNLRKQHFPYRFFQWYFPRGLNLSVKDTFNTRKTKKGGRNEATYLLGYPFEYLLTFIVGCKEIVKFFHNHHFVKAQFRQA